MNRILNILIADPSEIIFGGLTALLNGHKLKADFHRAESLDDIHRLLAGKTINLVIVNPSLLQNNIKAFNTFRSMSLQVKWIALVYAYYDERLLSTFDAVVTINDGAEKIVSVIRAVTESDDAGNEVMPHASLSDREIEVLRLLASGLATKEIADALSISTNTVISHRKNISVKTGIKSVSGLTIYAVVKKFITLGNIPG